MPRMPRVEYAGAIYHVTVRMVGHAWETGQEQDRRVTVCDGDDETSCAIKASSLAVGGPDFLEQIRERLIARAGARLWHEDADLRPLKSALPVEEALKAVTEILGVDRQALNERRRNSDLRGVALRASMEARRYSYV